MVELYVDGLMSRPVETVSPDTPIREAAARLLEHDVGVDVSRFEDRCQPFAGLGSVGEHGCRPL